MGFECLELAKLMSALQGSPTQETEVEGTKGTLFYCVRYNYYKILKVCQFPSVLSNATQNQGGVALSLLKYAYYFPRAEFSFTDSFMS